MTSLSSFPTVRHLALGVQREPVEGKGNGLVARAEIPPFTILCVETPMLSVDITPKLRQEQVARLRQTRPDPLDELEEEELEDQADDAALRITFADVYASLPPIYKQAVLELHESQHNPDLYTTFEHNRYARPASDDQYIRDMYLVLTYGNHSCAPNCRVYFASDGSAKLVSVCAISPGQELTYSYLDDNLLLEDAELRHTLLQNEWGFDCSLTCDSNSPDSDKARSVVRRQLAKLKDPFVVQNAADLEQRLQETVTTLTQVGLSHFVPVAYEGAAKVAELVGAQDLLDSLSAEFLSMIGTDPA